MIIKEGVVVTLKYDLHEAGPGGELLERMDVNYPFTFLFGNGNLLPSFEKELLGLSPKSSFQFTLLPHDAYGLYRNDQVLWLARDVFVDRSGLLTDDMLNPGNSVKLRANDGRDHVGKVLRIDDGKVLVDFNHAMAGKTLHFVGVVLYMREATVDELVRGHHFEDTGLRNRW